MMFVVRVPDSFEGGRDMFRKRLQDDHGIQTKVHYPLIWTWDFYSACGTDLQSHSHSATVGRQIVSLPIHSQMEDWEVERVIQACRTVTQ